MGLPNCSRLVGRLASLEARYTQRMMAALHRLNPDDQAGMVRAMWQTLLDAGVVPRPPGMNVGMTFAQYCELAPDDAQAWMDAHQDAMQHTSREVRQELNRLCAAYVQRAPRQQKGHSYGR